MAKRKTKKKAKKRLGKIVKPAIAKSGLVQLKPLPSGYDAACMKWLHKAVIKFDPTAVVFFSSVFVDGEPNRHDHEIYCFVTTALGKGGFSSPTDININTWDDDGEFEGIDEFYCVDELNWARANGTIYPDNYYSQAPPRKRKPARLCEPNWNW